METQSELSLGGVEQSVVGSISMTSYKIIIQPSTTKMSIKGIN